MSTTRLYLIRHGSTILTAEDRFSGGTEVDLSDEGRWQAACLAKRLADDHIVAIYCSPMRRTTETATIIGRPYSLVPIPRDGLREIHHGRWETMRRSDVERQYPEEYGAWQEDPFTFAPQGGESGVMVMARALPVKAGMDYHSDAAMGLEVGGQKQKLAMKMDMQTTVESR